MPTTVSGGMILTRETSVPVNVLPTKITNGMTQAQNRASAVAGRPAGRPTKLPSHGTDFVRQGGSECNIKFISYLVENKLYTYIEITSANDVQKLLLLLLLLLLGIFGIS